VVAKAENTGVDGILNHRDPFLQHAMLKREISEGAANSDYTGCIPHNIEHPRTDTGPGYEFHLEAPNRHEQRNPQSPGNSCATDALWIAEMGVDRV
jgi:hypothetical protein